MERLQSWEQFKQIRKQVQENASLFFSNIYFWPAEMKRYIELQRAYYELCEAGILLFFDEEKFYRLMFCIDLAEDFEVTTKEKLILVRNIYKDIKGKELLTLDDKLTVKGFEYKGLALATQADVEKTICKNKMIEKHKELLEHNGFSVIRADAERYSEIEALLKRVPYLEEYHIPYRTMEEKKSIAEKGGYLCIVNKDNDICAVAITEVENGVGNGIAIAVDEKYRMSGMAAVLGYERLCVLSESGVKIVNGSVLKNNEASKRTFVSMGYDILNRQVDEWIRKN